MARLTFDDAERIAGNSRPWSIRLEFRGPNPNNAGGWSEKFWFATGRAKHEPVETGWGAIGALPQYQLVDWANFVTKVTEKVAKGYDYVDAPFVRMSQDSLNKLGGTVKTVGGPTPAAPNAPSPPPVLPSSPAPQIQVNTGTTPVNAKLLALGEPWSLVRSLRVKRNSSTVLGYDALDNKGSVLFGLDPQQGVQAAQDYDLDVAWF